MQTDKVSGSDEDKQAAKEEFQQIALAYAVLSDPARRKRYDATGDTSETLAQSDGFSWSEFYAEQFRDAVSEDAIKKFAEKYKNSDEEKDDLLVAYEKHKGNMNNVYEEVMLSNVLEDDERFRAVLDEAIANKDIKAFKAYTNESKKSKDARVKAAKGEAVEAEEYAKELGVHDKLFNKKGKKSKKDPEADLAALIQRNQKSRSGFFDNLEAKYGGGGGMPGMPSEEEFQAASRKLGKRKSPTDDNPKSSKGGRSKKSKT